MKTLTVLLLLLVSTPAAAQNLSFTSKEVLAFTDNKKIDDARRSPIAGNDPVVTAPAPGPTPELGAPLLYSLAASLSVSNESTKVTAILAPFQLWDVKTRILRDTRLEVSTGIDKQLRWGAYVTIPWSTLSEPALLSKEIVEAMVQECYSYTESESIQIQHLINSINAEFTLGGAAQMGPALPDESINMYGARVATEAKRPPATARRLDLAKELIELQTSLRKPKTDCFEKKLRTERTKRAVEGYKNEFTLGIRLGSEFFPLIDEPKVSDGMGGTVDPSPEPIASLSANLTASWFPDRRTGTWIVIGLADKRSDIKDEDADKRFGLGLRVAHNLYKDSKVEPDGFQAGVAVGVDASISMCIEDADTNPCGEPLVSYKEPVEIDSLITASPYIDIRASSKIQVRLSIPVQVYDLSAPPVDSDGSERVTQFAPSLSVTFSGWPI